MKKYLSLLFLSFFSASLTFGQAIGTKAPDFTLNSLDNGQIILSDYIGKVVYLYFFGYN